MCLFKILFLVPIYINITHFFIPNRLIHYLESWIEKEHRTRERNLKKMAKSNTKLTNLLSIEKEMQSKWASEKIFEEDAPDTKWWVKISSFSRFIKHTNYTRQFKQARNTWLRFPIRTWTGVFTWATRSLWPSASSPSAIIVSRAKSACIHSDFTALACP